MIMLHLINPFINTVASDAIQNMQQCICTVNNYTHTVYTSEWQKAHEGDVGCGNG